MTSPQPAPQASATGLPPGVEAGGLGKRFVAQLIDSVIPAILGAGAYYGALMLGGTPGMIVQIAGGVLILAWAAFVCWSFAVKAAGPGMRLMGLQLVGFYDGRPIGWGRFLLRSLVLYALRVTGIGLLIMVVLLIMHPRKQGWHDLLAHSVVIKHRPLAPPMPRPVPSARRQEIGPAQQPGQYAPSGPGQSAPSYQPTAQPYQPVAQQPPPLTPPPGIEAGYRPGAGAPPGQYGPQGQPPGGYGAPGQQQPGPYGQPGQQYPPVAGFPTGGPDSYPGDPYRGQGQAAQYPAGGYGADPYRPGPPVGGYQPSPSGMPTASASAPPVAAPPVAAPPVAAPPGAGMPPGGAVPAGLRPPTGQPPTGQPPTGRPPTAQPPPEVPPYQAAPSGSPAEVSAETQLAGPPPGYQQPAAAAPPQTGWLAVLDDGRELSLTGLVLLGRNPQAQPGEEDAQLIKIADETRTVSKSHLAIAVDSGGVFVVDRGSTNGSTVTTSNGVSTRCAAGEIVRVAEGSIVSIGDHWLEIRRTT
jgi:uncharacterized RDD family membrane protein YckC